MGRRCMENNILKVLAYLLPFLFLFCFLVMNILNFFLKNTVRKYLPDDFSQNARILKRFELYKYNSFPNEPKFSFVGTTIAKHVKLYRKGI